MIDNNENIKIKCLALINYRHLNQKIDFYFPKVASLYLNSGKEKQDCSNSIFVMKKLGKFSKRRAIELIVYIHA